MMIDLSMYARQLVPPVSNSDVEIKNPSID
jgi:hypothetical protein